MKNTARAARRFMPRRARRKAGNDYLRWQLSAPMSWVKTAVLVLYSRMSKRMVAPLAINLRKFGLLQTLRPSCGTAASGAERICADRVGLASR